MGSTGKKLKIFDPDDREASAKSMKASRVADLRAWPPKIAGIPLVPASALPTPELAGALADAIENSDELSSIDYMWHDVASTLDSALPEGTPFMAQFIFDPTYAIDLEFFIEMMVDFGIPAPDVPGFVLEKMPEVGEAITLLSMCKFEEFGEKMAELHPNIEAGPAASKGEALGCPPFELPELGIIPFALPSFSLPDFGLNITPIKLVLPDINIDFPQLHISILWIIQAIIDAILALLEMAINLALKIIEGIIAFVVFVIEFLINLIVAIILELLQALAQFIGFLAGIITLIAKALRFVVVLIVGYLIGAGMIALAVLDAVSS